MTLFSLKLLLFNHKRAKTLFVTWLSSGSEFYSWFYGKLWVTIPRPNNLSKRLGVWLNHMTLSLHANKPAYSIDVARSKGTTWIYCLIPVLRLIQYHLSASICLLLLFFIYIFPISSSCTNNNQQNVRFTLYQRISRYFLTAVIKTLIVSLCKKTPVETLVVLFRAVTAGRCVVVLNSVFNSTLLCFFPRFFF